MLLEMNSTVANKDMDGFVFSPEDKARVLIIDDEDDIRFALTRILNLEGYVAEEVSSGQKALALLQQNKYDLVILDMRMPGMSGLEVMEYISKYHPELLIIILTGQATLDSAITATKLECVVNYLLKPCRTDEFISAVKEALKKKVRRHRQHTLVTAAAQVLNVMHPPMPGPDSSTPPPVFTQKKQSEQFIQIYPVTLDCKKRLITIMDQNPVQLTELTKGETAILSTLMTHANHTLSCDELVNLALGYETENTDAESLIRPYIFRLRRKLEANPAKPCLIRTVRRRGYRFNSMNG